MGVLQMDRCHYCGAEVFYEEDMTLVKCRACGHTLRIADFLTEQIKLDKAIQAEQAARQELTAARNESKEAQDRLYNTLSVLNDLRNSSSLQEDQLQQIISSLDINKEDQDALRNMLLTLGNSEQNAHAQISDLIRTIMDSQDTLADKLQAVQSFSKKLLEDSDNTMSLISSLSDLLHTDTSSMNLAINKLVAWTQAAHNDDIAFLNDIQNVSTALLESQSLALQKISDIEKQQQLASDQLKQFESKWEKNQLNEIIGLYHQAECFQADREYEKAAEYYRQVIIKGGKDPEVLWRIVQCHYGVDAQIDNEGNSIITILCPDLSDPAEMSIRKELENSLNTNDQKNYYHSELKKIDSILDKYRHYRLEVSYDIFISVKQKDNGHYTEDSDLGSELYYYLKNQGYRVFNSRRSIPAGVEYEPYILAALLSAKVLIVVGSCPEYINSQWVKNEWSRFQWFKKHENTNGSSERVLLCYLSRSMDPYTIPKSLNPDCQAIIDGLNAEQSLANALTKAFHPPAEQPLINQARPTIQDAAKSSKHETISEKQQSDKKLRRIFPVMRALFKSYLYALLCLLAIPFAWVIWFCEDIFYSGWNPDQEGMPFPIMIIMLTTASLIIQKRTEKKGTLKTNLITRLIGGSSIFSAAWVGERLITWSDISSFSLGPYIVFSFIAFVLLAFCGAVILFMRKAKT